MQWFTTSHPFHYVSFYINMGTSLVGEVNGLAVMAASALYLMTSLGKIFCLDGSEAPKYPQISKLNRS